MTECGFEVLDHIPLGVMVVDREMRTLFWNACLEDWTGLERQVMLGSDVRERLPHLWNARYAARLRELFESGAPAVFSSQLHPHFVPAPLRSGRLRVLHTTAVAIPHDGEFRALITVQDVTGVTDAMALLQKARDEARHRASTDDLTGVAARSHFLDMAARGIATARRYHRDLSLLMLDVDRFKVINDTYGHAAGDAVLLTLARVCGADLREGDVLGRLGGDEFAVLLPETPTETARQVAGRLRDALSASGVAWEGRRLRLEVSVGVASLTPESGTVDELLARADEALYEAKRQGRNCVVVR